MVCLLAVAKVVVVVSRSVGDGGGARRRRSVFVRGELRQQRERTSKMESSPRRGGREPEPGAHSSFQWWCACSMHCPKEQQQQQPEAVSAAAGERMKLMVLQRRAPRACSVFTTRESDERNAPAASRQGPSSRPHRDKATMSSLMEGGVCVRGKRECEGKK